MIFHQFGLNVVRNVRSEYHYYEEGLSKQVDYLRNVSGGAPVVLVSLTDMALRSDDTIIPYRNIPAIRDAQKRAAATERGNILGCLGGDGRQGLNSQVV